MSKLVGVWQLPCNYTYLVCLPCDSDPENSEIGCYLQVLAVCQAGAYVEVAGNDNTRTSEYGSRLTLMPWGD